MNNEIKLANFTHVMNDDMVGTTFVYFSEGTVQDLDNGTEHEYREFCIWLDEQQHRKLEAALRNEPYDCVVFTPQEMEIIKDHIPYPEAMTKPVSFSDSEWKEFLNKL